MPLTVEIVTPEGRVFKDDAVDSVVIPTTAGELGVLPGHIPLLTQTVAGELRARKGAAEERLIIGTGFAQISNDRVAVAAEHAIDEDEIDAGRVEEAIRNAKERLERARAADGQEAARVERLVGFLQAQLRRKRP